MEYDDGYSGQRSRMVQEQIVARGIRDELLLRAFMEAPRHLFVDKPYQEEAYEDRSLPLTLSNSYQMISQPYVIALMLEEALKVKRWGSLLEIGSGSGYLLAIASKLFKKVVGVERVKELVEKSQNIFEQLSIDNVEVIYSNALKVNEILGDVRFDSIIVSCAMEKLPESFVSLLNTDGLLIAPIGDKIAQELTVFIKDKNGGLRKKGAHGVVRLQPLVSSD